MSEHEETYIVDDLLARLGKMKVELEELGCQVTISVSLQLSSKDSRLVPRRHTADAQEDRSNGRKA